MVVTFFDTIGGFSAYNTLIEIGREPAIEPSELYRSQPILDNSVIVMPRRTKGVVMLSRYSQRGITVTWFGLYRPLPARMSNRGGSYCGVGIHVAERIAPAAVVIRALEALLDVVTADMEAEGPSGWRSKDAYDRALDAQSPLDQFQKHLSGGRIIGGIDPAGAGCCAVDLEVCALPLSDVADEAQNGDGFGAFQRVLIARDEEAFLMVNRRVVTAVDGRGTATDKGLPLRASRADPLPARDAPEPGSGVRPRRSTPSAKDVVANDVGRFADEARPPRFSKAGVALTLASLNSAVLVAWAVSQAVPRLEAKVWPESDEAVVAGLGAAPVPASAADLRTGDPSRAGSGRGLSEQQLRSVSDAVARLLNDDVVQRTPPLRTQLEQVRDMLRPAAAAPAGRSDGPR